MFTAQPNNGHHKPRAKRRSQIARYDLVVERKTAVLIAWCASVAGLLPTAYVEPLRRYGSEIGHAFQIADDLLDYQGDSASTGKNVGDDFRERKLTLPVIKAVARATADERAFWVRTIEKGKQTEGDLDTALSLMAKYNTLEETRTDAVAWADKARTALTRLPDHPIRLMLNDLSDYVVARLL